MKQGRRRVIAMLAGLLGLCYLVALIGMWWGGSWTRQEVLDALRHVESSGRDDVADGDGGRAIGPYQIHRSYWLDSVRFRPELGGRYEDCRGRDYAERVIAAYMERWVPEAWHAVDAEVIARTHNGGPRGRSKYETLEYWEKVMASLDLVANAAG